MTNNMANLDRLLRIAVVLLVGVLYFTQVIGGTLALVLGIISGIFFLTSLVGFCPLYAVFGFSSRKLTNS